MVEGTTTTTSRTSWEIYNEKMGGYLCTFLVATAVILMIAMALVLIVFLATGADEKEYTVNDEMNKEIGDLLQADASGLAQNTDTTTEKPTAATMTPRSPWPTPSTPTSTRTTPTTTTPTTTTARKTSRKPPEKSLLAGSLLCTLGAIRFSTTYIYPVDGLCDLITFDSLFVAGGITLSPPYNDEFYTFLETAGGHRRTEYAIGIDHNFCRNENLMRDLIANPATKTTLDDMWSKRIHHYGQVNTPVMQASGNPFEYVTQSARGLQMISQLMSARAVSENQTSFTILHYPLMYDSMAADVAKALTSYPVDILVAIGYTSYSDYGTKDCRMVPPVLHTTELLEPSLLNTSYPVRLVRVLSAMAKFKELAATSAVAVSFGMGGRWYTPKYPDNLPYVPGNFSLGHQCATSSQGGGPEGHQITSIAEACAKSNYMSTLNYDETFQAEFAYDKSENMLFTYDNSASIRFKLFETKGLPTGLQYNLAADNVQYEDFDNVCGRGTYGRLRIMKTLVGFSG